MHKHQITKERPSICLSKENNITKKKVMCFIKHFTILNLLIIVSYIAFLMDWFIVQKLNIIKLNIDMSPSIPYFSNILIIAYIFSTSVKVTDNLF